MQWTSLVLDFVARIAWPVALGIVLWWLREPIKRRIEDLRKVEFGSWGLELADQELREEIEDSAEALGTASAHPVDVRRGATDGAGVSDEAQAEVIRGSEVDGQSPHALEITTNARKAIEDLVAAAARWGHRRGAAGYRDAVPTITWDADGKPVVDLPPVQHAVIRSEPKQVAQDYISNLEARVKELESERARATYSMRTFVDPTATMALDKQLEDAKDRLRQVHPTSGLL